MIVPRNSISFSLPQKADSQMEPANIADLIRAYVRAEASEEETRIVREYIMADLNHFDILLRIMREEAMLELHLDPADDFLAEQLRRCAPKAFAERPRIGDKDTDKDKPKADMFRAGRPQRTAIPAFQILKDNILPD